MSSDENEPIDRYAPDHDDLPEALQELDEELFVKAILEYQSPGIDYSVILKEGRRVTEMRVYWLRDLRDEWQWVDDSDGDESFVLLKQR